MDKRAKEGNCRRLILEDLEANEGFFGDVRLVNDKSDKPNTAQNKRDKRAPRVPVVHDTAPGKRDEEAGGRSDEDDSANPVDAAELGGEGGDLVVEGQEQDDHDGAETEEGEVDPEDPAPGDFLREGAADEGACDCADGPHGRNTAEPLASEAERDHVCDDDFGEGDDTL